MSKHISNDLTKGSVWKQLLKFAMPFLVSNILQAVYSIVDMLVVGRFNGSAGISAVDLGGRVMMVLGSLIIGLTIGGTVLVAQYTGARQTDNVKKTISTLFGMFAIIGVFLTIISLLLCDAILRAIGTTPEVFEWAKEYLSVCIIGVIFIIGYNAVSSILRGLGDSKRPLYFVAIAAIINVGLDLLFVGSFKWGPVGAAYATTISQATSFLISVWYLKRSDFIFDFKLKSFMQFDKKIALGIFKIGLPSSIQMTLAGLSFLFIAGLVNSFGYEAAAASGIGGKVDSIAILPGLAVSSAISSMVAQNIGAGMMDRAKSTLKCGMLFSFAMSVVIFIIVQIFTEQFVYAFGDQSTINSTTVYYSVEYLRIASVSYLLFAVMFCFNGFATGTGFSIFAMINTLVAVVLLRIPLAMYLSGFMGMHGVYISLAFAPVGGVIVGAIFYLSGMWKRSAIVRMDKVGLSE